MSTEFLSKIRRNAGLLYGLLCIFLTSLMLFVAASEYYTVYVVASFVFAIGETALIMLPYWWLGGRWRWSVLIPVWVLSIFMFANTLYFRAFGMLIPFTLISTTKNMHPMVMGSALGLVRTADIIYLLAPAVATVLIAAPGIRRKIYESTIKKSTKVVLTVLTLLLFGATFYGYSLRFMRREGLPIIETTRHWDEFVKTHFFEKMDCFDQRHYERLLLTGLLVYIGHETYFCLKLSRFDLNNRQKAALSEYIDRCSEYKAPRINAKGRNLVFVVVESLDAEAIGLKFNGMQVTPTLNALLDDSTTVGCIAVRSQVRMCTSADGQLMYNTGLLPCKSHPTVDYLPGLNIDVWPKEYSNVVVMADDGLGWGKIENYKAFGFDESYSNKDFNNLIAEGKTTDGALMQFGLEKLKELDQPFNLQLLTIQMHHPVTDYSTPATLDFSGYDITAERQRYFNATADFDRALGLFIDGLKKAGLWENTLLVVASDHQYPTTKKADGSCGDIVFVAANAGTGRRIDKANQVDIFPTVLDLLGVESNWRGVGRSMLLPDSLRLAVDEARQASVSDSILRSDYFIR